MFMTFWCDNVRVLSHDNCRLTSVFIMEKMNMKLEKYTNKNNFFMKDVITIGVYLIICYIISFECGSLSENYSLKCSELCNDEIQTTDN